MSQPPCKVGNRVSMARSHQITVLKKHYFCSLIPSQDDEQVLILICNQPPLPGAEHVRGLSVQVCLWLSLPKIIQIPKLGDLFLSPLPGYLHLYSQDIISFASELLRSSSEFHSDTFLHCNIAVYVKQHAFCRQELSYTLSIP